ncbi:low molecular weight phosphatase family protein [Streptomyces sp. NPDC018833]|uniref:arsenate reductase/protein-tyrosine-phosphatase family protein n=1 Tax=Streptomyces sp. NPDC018833 TaxID=3365053 RepID=UPI00378D7D06
MEEDPDVLLDHDSSSGTSCAPEFRVLTVCTGNLYRSPLTECLLRKRLATVREAIHVGSAGTRAVPGTPMEAALVPVIVERCGDPSERVARRLTAGLVESADLVLGAAVEHREAAVRLAPVRALSRAFSLREFARLVRAEDGADVVDPVARFTALVAGAAARRGAAPAGMADDDVADPLGGGEEVVRECVRRIEESVERIAVAMGVD